MQRLETDPTVAVVADNGGEALDFGLLPAERLDDLAAGHDLARSGGDGGVGFTFEFGRPFEQCGAGPAGEADEGEHADRGEHQRHVEDGQADHCERQHAQDADGERQRMDDLDRGVGVGVEPGEQLPRRAGPDPVDRHVDESAGDVALEAGLDAGGGHAGEVAADDHPGRAEHHDPDDQPGGRPLSRPAAVEQGDERLVGGPPERDGGPHRTGRVDDRTGHCDREWGGVRTCVPAHEAQAGRDGGASAHCRNPRAS